MIYIVSLINIIRSIRKMSLDHLDKNAQRRVMAESRKYYWDAPYLFRLGAYGVLRRCVPREERLEILRKCHSGEYGLVGSIARRCIKMRKGMLLLVWNVKERGIYQQGMLCL
jgi:hypothetical protein